MIHFTVYGTPQPKGSFKAFLPKGSIRPIITNDSKRTKPWQESVAWAAREALKGAKPLQGPVHLTVTCYLPRPKSTPKRVKFHTKRPDIDKLLRTICDALTRAGVYRDDSQVVTVSALKRFGEVPGVDITVGEVE